MGKNHFYSLKQANEELNKFKSYSEALEFYENTMKSILATTESYLSESKLEVTHQETKKVALEQVSAKIS